MDMRDTNILQTECDALAAALAKAKPSKLERLELALAEERRKRGEAQSAFNHLCAEHRKLTPGKPPGADFVALEKLIKKYDAEIGSLRGQITQARMEWGNTFHKKVRVHLDATVPALDNALRALEAAQQVFAIYDAYCRNNALGSYITPRSMKLEELARDLKRFLKDQSR